jgi:hypothetical protein
MIHKKPSKEQNFFTTNTPLVNCARRYLETEFSLGKNARYIWCVFKFPIIIFSNKEFKLTYLYEMIITLYTWNDV